VTWFKVDDGFWSHPKTATLSDAAVTLWVRSGAYSCQHLTDGVIARPVLRLVGTEAAASELVAAGLWLDHPEGWAFHDWADYQPTKEDVEADRAAARERMRERRRNKRGKFAGSSPERSPEQTEKFAVRSSTPTRPDPTRPSTSNEVDNSRVDDAFARAYSHWPKKTERKKSLAKFKTAAGRYGVEFIEAHVVRFGEAYAATTERQFVPALNVWLNGERWTDDLPTAGPDVVDKQWQALMGGPADPCANGHRWTVDGTCANCTEERDG
jgi:hypothetical protein